MKWDIQEVQIYVSIIKDVVTGISALTVAVIGILGLQAWKKQLKGKTEYELAQKFLQTIYKLRGAVNDARKPHLSNTETFQAMKEKDIEVSQLGEPNSRALIEFSVYAKRRQKIRDAILDLELIEMEAEVHWGQSMKGYLEILKNTILELDRTIMAYITDLFQPSFLDAYDKKRRSVVMYENVDNPLDDLDADKLTGAIRKIEVFLKPRLKI